MRATSVLHVIPSLNIGGAEMSLARLAATPREGRPEARVVTLMPATGSRIEDELRDAGIPVSSLDAQDGWGMPSAVFKLANTIKDFQPDCIQGWLYYGDLAATLALLRSGRRKTTRLYWGIRCSDMDFSQYGRQLRWTVKACARLSRTPDAIIANSVAGRIVHENLGYRADKFEVIPNGIDRERFVPDPQAGRRFQSEFDIPTDQPIVVAAARVDPQKDYDTFLKVVSGLPNVTFIAAGSGTEMLPHYANLIRLGAWNEMPYLFAAADLAICTSAFGEGFPTVIGEAMACGTPVVTTDVGDARAIVGDCGTTCAVGDVAGLVAAISKLLSEASDERRQQARARIIHNFSLDRMINRFDALHANGSLPSSHQDPQAA